MQGALYAGESRPTRWWGGIERGGTRPPPLPPNVHLLPPPSSLPQNWSPQGDLLAGAGNGLPVYLLHVSRRTERIGSPGYGVITAVYSIALEEYGSSQESLVSSRIRRGRVRHRAAACWEPVPAAAQVVGMERLVTEDGVRPDFARDGLGQHHWRVARMRTAEHLRREVSPL